MNKPCLGPQKKDIFEGTMSHLNYPMIGWWSKENLKSLKIWPKDAQRHGVTCCCTINKGDYITNPNNNALFTGNPSKLPFFSILWTFDSPNQWAPIDPDIFGRKNSTTNKFPVKPMGNFPPSTLKAKHLSNAARFATRPAGPVIDLLIWKAEGKKLLEMPCFLGWMLVHHIPAIWNWYIFR